MSSSVKNPEQIRQERLELIYSDRWINKLTQYTERKYYNFGGWQSWVEEALQHLAEKINKFPTERNLSDAWIFTVYKNELTSVIRKHNGYPRPRKWLLEYCDMGQSLFEWVCLKKFTRSETLNAAKEQSQEAATTTASREQEEEFKKMIETILDLMDQKQECAGVRPVQADDEGADPDAMAATQISTEDEADLEKLRLVLQLLIGDENAVSQYMHTSATGTLAKIRNALQDNPLLSNEETLILRCYYFQGMSQNDIAKLTKKNLQVVVRQREAAIKRLREFMESQGLDKNSLL